MVWSLLVVWEEFLNKKVSVRQTDGFVKYGILREVKEGFIKIEFSDGSQQWIANGFISFIGFDNKENPK